MTEHATGHARSHAHVKATPEGAPDRLPVYELEADAMRALAHPKRLLVLDLLSDGSERNVSELMEWTGLPQSNLSQHLAVMRTAGLITPRRDGNAVYYKLADSRVTKAVALMRTVMATQVENRRTLLEREAAETKTRRRRTTMLGVHALALVLAAALTLAVTHPLLVGGAPADVPAHVQMMTHSPDVATFLDICMNARTR